MPRPDERSRLIAAAGALGLAPDESQLDALLHFLDLLERWNRAYNLTAVRQRSDMLVQHLFDCMALVSPLLRGVGGGGRLLDVGSGGGLPGVVVALLAPGFDVTCVDAVGKKAAFVRQGAGELGLRNLTALHARVEALDGQPFVAVTSRALASLSEFVRLTQDRLAPGGLWIAMKGQLPSAELAELPPTVDAFHVERLTVPELAADRCLVWMRPKLRYPPTLT